MTFRASLVGQAWKGKYRGQKQKWFALRFTGTESEIDVEHPDGGAHSRSSPPGAGSRCRTFPISWCRSSARSMTAWCASSCR